MPRSSKSEAAETRAAILDRAVELGSVEGLEAVSIGRLAGELGLSKAGVVGPFGSKGGLQLAAVLEGISRFRAEVWEPAAGEPAGRRRLEAIAEAWFSYLEREVFPGGCFMTAASLEFDGRPGPIRDAIAGAWSIWMRTLEHEAAIAQRQGELAADPSPGQVAFQLNAHVLAGNWSKQLFGGRDALTPARAAAAGLLAPAGAATSGR